jgi:hypothetical protein
VVNECCGGQGTQRGNSKLRAKGASASARGGDGDGATTACGIQMRPLERQCWACGRRGRKTAG